MSARCFHTVLFVLCPLVSAFTGTIASADETPPTDWAARIETAKQAFVPIKISDVQAAKKRLNETLDVLEVDLGTSGPTKALGWKRYLMWEPLTSELQKESPDIRVLQEAGSKLTGPHAGLERISMRNAREALQRYIILDFYQRDKRLQERTAVQLDRLAADLEKQATEPSSELEHRIGAKLGFLESIGQAPELLGDLRTRYGHPNFQVSFSAAFFRKALQRPVMKPGYVAQNILGTEVRGHSTTLGTVCIYPRESYDAATFEICMEGNVHSSTVGRNGPATICSESNAVIAAWRRFTFDPTGFAAGPVNASAQSRTTITGLSTRPNFIRGFVVRKAMKSKPAAERIASARTRREVATGFETETNATIAKLQDQYLKEVLYPLKRHDQEPRLFDVTTTNDATTLSWFQANEVQIGAMTPAPEFLEESDVSARIHESAFRNLIESMLAGKSYGRDDLASVKSSVSPSTDAREGEPEAVEDDEAFTVSFDSNMPVVVGLRDNQVSIAVNIRRFQREGQAEAQRVRLQATYDLSPADSGISLTRVGDPQVTFPGSKRLSVRQLTLKTFILKRIDKVIPEEIKTTGFAAPATLPQLSKVGKFTVHEATTDNGWLSIGWNVSR